VPPGGAARARTAAGRDEHRRQRQQADGQRDEVRRLADAVADRDAQRVLLADLADAAPDRVDVRGGRVDAVLAQERQPLGRRRAAGRRVADAGAEDAVQAGAADPDELFEALLAADDWMVGALATSSFPLDRVSFAARSEAEQPMYTSPAAMSPLPFTPK
jgi:hypothetical protein